MKKQNFFTYILTLLDKKKKKQKSIEDLLSKEGVVELKSRLEWLMENKRPFLQKGYHLKNMADDLNIPLHQLSAFINQVHKMHFNDIVNQYRIAYCESLIKSKTVLKPNLKDMSERCGFNNRNTFADAFKKFTGQRFSDYIKDLQVYGN